MGYGVREGCRGGRTGLKRRIINTPGGVIFRGGGYINSKQNPDKDTNMPNAPRAFLIISREGPINISGL